MSAVLTVVAPFLMTFGTVPVFRRVVLLFVRSLLFFAASLLCKTSAIHWFASRFEELKKFLGGLVLNVEPLDLDLLFEVHGSST